MNNLRKLAKGIFIKFKQINWKEYSWGNLDKTKLLVPFGLFTHPIETFNDIKHEGRGSLGLANLILALFFVEGVLDYFFIGYLFSNNDVQQFSLIPIFVQTILIVILWCVANWAMSTLLEGSGTFKEIWIATCYSLIPLVIFQVPLNLISNVMTLSEGMFYTSFSVVFTLWTLMLVFFGMMVVHDFTVAKTFGSSLLSLGMIVIVAFLALLAFSIFQQMSMFVQTIMTEITRR